MPRKSAKQRRSKQTVRAILEAAAQVFEQDSYDNGTTDRIAERAGVSIGTLYQYFPDKEAILNILLEQHVERAVSSLADLAEQVRDAKMPLRQAVHCMVWAVARQQEAGARLHRAGAEVEAVPPSVGESSRAHHARLLTAVRRLMEASSQVGVKDLDCASYLVVVVVDSAVHGYLAHPPSNLTLESYLDHVTSMVMAYLTTPIEPRGGQFHRDSQLD